MLGLKRQCSELSVEGFETLVDETVSDIQYYKDTLLSSDCLDMSKCKKVPLGEIFTSFINGFGFKSHNFVNTKIDGYLPVLKIASPCKRL